MKNGNFFNNKWLDKNYNKKIEIPPYQYHTADIGNVAKKNLNDGSMSTFNNVIYTVETLNRDLANDLRSGKKNLENLIKKLIDINDEGKIELSNIAKDLSNKIVYIYDNLVTCINEQRSENLKLQFELAKASKEKNELKHEVELLTEAVRKLEVALGIEPDGAFEAMLKYANNGK